MIMRRKIAFKASHIMFVKFLVVGGINTLFGYGIFAFFLYIGLHYSLAALFSTILGIFFNFKTTGRLVFGSKDNSLIFKFFGVYGFTYIFNVMGLKIFLMFGVNNYIAGAILMVPMVIMAFLLQKKYVFEPKS